MLYAVIDGVCGLAEGYSDTSAKWFNSLDEAVAYKNRMLKDFISDYDRVDSVESSTDGMRDVIIWNTDESEESFFQVIPVNPVWPDTPSVREYLIWNQVDCEAPFGGEYLPTDMAVVKDLCERLEAVADEVSTDTLHEFIRDLWYNGDAMFDADDLCIHYFRIPKSTQQ